MTPFFKWGGKIQDAVMEKTHQIFESGSPNEGYAQKTKRLIRNSWKAFTTKVHDAKETISEKLHRNTNE